ncbi:MAG: IS200/IS605 family transposase [bacterium]|nr:IS200/IS605 family transposase [bacterium]
MSNTYTNLRHHLIFDCRDQQRLISPRHSNDLYRYVNVIIRNHRGRLLAIGGMEDHVHLLTGIHPSLALSSLVRSIKANSSKWMTQCGASPGWFRWEAGYGAFTVSEVLVPKVREFIGNQAEYHQKKSFTGELGEIVKRHGFEFHEDPARRQRTYAWQRVHLVFSTKNRTELIPAAVEGDLYATTAELVAQMRGELLEINGTSDHVHLLVALQSDVAVADLLHSIKLKSTNWMMKPNGPGLPFAWQRGYGAFSVSLSQLPAIRRYIQRQKEHHRRVSFADEFRELLEEHGLVLQDLG